MKRFNRKRLRDFVAAVLLSVFVTATVVGQNGPADQNITGIGGTFAITDFIEFHVSVSR